MPTTATKLSTTLEDVKAQFVHWRTTRTKMGKIPDSLWEAVRPLTQKRGYAQIASELGLSCSQLRSKIRYWDNDNEEHPQLGMVDFVEVTPLHSPVPSSSPSTTPLPLQQEANLNPTLELTRRDGTTLKATGLGHQEMLGLVERFLG